MSDALLGLIAHATADRSERGIAATVSRLITAHHISIGERLPTVRLLARELGVSPTTVSEAWQTLGSAGIIESRGRLGTFVVGSVAESRPTRYRRITDAPGEYRLDLSTGTPDPALLPDISGLLAQIDQRNLTHSYLDDPVLPALVDVLAGMWPFKPESVTVVDGVLDAIDRVASAIIRYGDRVVVENPCFAPLLDLFELLGAQVIPVELDEHGITPESLRLALTHDPVALFLQPRAHNPTGITMTSQRAAALAKVLAPSRCVVVEDDHSGASSGAALASIGRHLPGRTVYILGFSKSHGPDLRLAAVGGSASVVDAVIERRTLGAGWSSRILQSVLVAMLTDVKVQRFVGKASDTYRRRRDTFVKLLDARGVSTTGTDGINLWLTVNNEQSCLLTMASLGVALAPGTPFLAAALASDHVRLTVGLVSERQIELADQLALATNS